MKKFSFILIAVLLIGALLLPVFAGVSGGTQPLLTVSAQADELEEFEEDFEEFEEDFEEVEEGGNTLIGVLLCFLVAFLIASLVIGILKGQLKSVELKTQADSYMAPTALELTGRDDLYTHTTTTRTSDPQDKGGDDDD